MNKTTETKEVPEQIEVGHNRTPRVSGESNRTPRELETRAEESHEPETFVPPGLLPNIKKHPDYEYRWIRVSTLGVSDNPNVNARFREGWEPVKASDHPEIKQFNPDSRYEGLVEHGGLMLCRASKKKIGARKKYYENMSAQQLDAVNNNLMRVNDPRMPLFREHSSRSTTGKGN